MSVLPKRDDDAGASSHYIRGSFPHLSFDEDPGSVNTLFETTTPESLLLMVRFPAVTFSAYRSSDVMRNAFEAIVPEPSDVSIIPHQRNLFSIVLTPKSGVPFDALQVNALLKLFQRALEDVCGLASITDLNLLPAVLPLQRVGSVDHIQENIANLNQLLETIVQKKFRIQFQPITSLKEPKVFGYEALVRMPQDGIMNRPGLYYQAADRARLVSWLDIACQEKCFEEAQKAGVRDYLFINMDAEGLSYFNLAERSLKEQAERRGISPSRVVIEITERQMVEDYPKLLHDIERMRTQGFKIAIDDAGEGYSSLRSISDMLPEFVKIDRAMIRSIENNGARQSLLRAVVDFSDKIGSHVIAEGVETRDELDCVMDQGVTLVQGYLLGKPNDGFRGVRREMREYITMRQQTINRRKSATSVGLSDIMLNGVTFTLDSPSEQILNKIVKNPDIESVVILNDGRIEGLLMREDVMKHYDGGKSSPSQVLLKALDRKPLIVEHVESVEAVAQKMALRPIHMNHHDALVEKNGEYAGRIPMRVLLRTFAEQSEKNKSQSVSR